jgi:hypothetical protein
MQMWPLEFVEKINRMQFDYRGMHPLTCPHRSGPVANSKFQALAWGFDYDDALKRAEVEHRDNGRDRAILVAKPEGYLECPFCGYRQHHSIEYLSEVIYQRKVEKGDDFSLNFGEIRGLPQEKPLVSYAEAAEVYKKVQANNAKLFGKTEEEYLAEHNQFFLIYRRPHPEELAERSGLLSRIMAGKQPLPYPPPKSGQYPWYKVVEEAGPHNVTVGFGGARPTMLNIVKASSVEEKQVSINHNPWEVVSMNPAAEAFLKWQESVEDVKSQEEIDEDKLNAILLEGLRLSQADVLPEFIVKDPFYGDFRLWLDPQGYSGSCYRYTLYQSNLERMKNFDIHLDLTNLNPVVVDVVELCTRERLDVPMYDALKDELGRQEESVREMIEGVLFSSKPEMDHDFVNYRASGWLLQRLGL